MNILIIEHSKLKCNMYVRYINSLIPGIAIDKRCSFDGSIDAIIQSYELKKPYDIILLDRYLSEYEYSPDINIEYKFGGLVYDCLKFAKYPAKIIWIDGDTMDDTNKQYEIIKSIIIGGKNE